MERIAPPWAAAVWDNVGLLVGDHEWPCQRVLLTIDMTAAVLDEALAGKSDAIISYHPPIFESTKWMRVGRWRQDGIAAEALSRRIAVYSPHTALDAAPDGTNDALARLCGVVSAHPYERAADPQKKCKLVVFVPESAVEKVAEAVFAVGAGRIGQYEKCSYRVSGHGTFFGTEGTTPRVGKRGRLETVEEVRLEIIFRDWYLDEVIAALKDAHPYEQPAYDVYPLTSLPAAGFGQGRIVAFPRPVRVGKLASDLKRRTGAVAVSLIGDPNGIVRQGLVCVGAAGSLPLESNSGFVGGVVITGEVRHHDALRFERERRPVIALGHWASERPVLKPLAARLRKELPGVEFVVSKADRDPFRPA